MRPERNVPAPPFGCEDNFTCTEFVTAAMGAKGAGAAGWTWHTEKLFRLASNYSPGLSNVEVCVIANLWANLHDIDWPPPR